MRSSNSIEICPVCLEYLKTRFGAMSHYRKHVRNGELIGRAGNADSGGQPKLFRFPDHEDRNGAWWDRGINYYTGMAWKRDNGRELNRAQNKFVQRHKYPALARFYR